MNSLITFGIDKMELDWSKSYLLSDFSSLFKDSDKTQLLCYYYDEYADEMKTTYVTGYSRKLSYIKRRLDLLGYTISYVKVLYEEIILRNNYSKKSNSLLMIFIPFFIHSMLLELMLQKKISTVQMILNMANLQGVCLLKTESC